MLKSIKFLRDTPPYAAGEIAGFDPAKAEYLVKKKRAVYNEVQASAVKPGPEVTPTPKLANSEAKPPKSEADAKGAKGDKK